MIRYYYATLHVGNKDVNAERSSVADFVQAS